MANKFYFFLFAFLFTIIFSSVGVLACSYTLPCPGGGDWCLCGYEEQINFSGPVSVTQSIDDIYLKANTGVRLPLNVNFYGYQWVNITTNDSGTIHSAYVLIADTSRECYNSPHVTFCLVPSRYSSGVGYIDLTIDSLNQDANISVNLVAGNELVEIINATENMTWASATNLEFYVFSGSQTSQGSTGLDSDYSFISAMANNFLNIFPDKDSVSTSAKFGMMLVTFLLVSIILYMLMWKAGGGTIHSFSHWIVGGVDFVLFLYFVGIGYVSIAVLIVLGLIVLLLAYLRTKAA